MLYAKHLANSPRYFKQHMQPAADDTPLIAQVSSGLLATAPVPGRTGARPLVPRQAHRREEISPLTTPVLCLRLCVSLTRTSPPLFLLSSVPRASTSCSRRRHSSPRTAWQSASTWAGQASVPSEVRLCCFLSSRVSTRTASLRLVYGRPLSTVPDHLCLVPLFRPFSGGYGAFVFDTPGLAEAMVRETAKAIDLPGGCLTRGWPSCFHFFHS